MAETSVLRGCEAVEVKLDGAVPCGEPGHPWEAPNGKSYVVCADHWVIFDPSMGGTK